MQENIAQRKLRRQRVREKQREIERKTTIFTLNRLRIPDVKMLSSQSLFLSNHSLLLSISLISSIEIRFWLLPFIEVYSSFFFCFFFVFSCSFNAYFLHFLFKFFCKVVRRDPIIIKCSFFKYECEDLLLKQQLLK